QTPARISCVKDVQNPRCVKERILSVAEATRTATETTKGQHQRENQTDSHAVQIPVWQSENHRLAASSRHRHFGTDCDPLHERDGHPFHHGKEIQGHNEFKTQPACVPQSPESELRGQSTRRSMGLRHHLCAYEGRLALSDLKITALLRQACIVISERTVTRYMKEMGIRSITAKKYKATTNSKHNLPVYPNLLNQNFEVSQRGEVWVSDITYVHTKAGWLY